MKICFREIFGKNIKVPQLYYVLQLRDPKTKKLPVGYHERVQRFRLVEVGISIIVDNYLNIMQTNQTP